MCPKVIHVSQSYPCVPKLYMCSKVIQVSQSYTSVPKLYKCTKLSKCPKVIKESKPYLRVSNASRCLRFIQMSWSCLSSLNISTPTKLSIPIKTTSNWLPRAWYLYFSTKYLVFYFLFSLYTFELPIKFIIIIIHTLNMSHKYYYR